MPIDRNCGSAVYTSISCWMPGLAKRCFSNLHSGMQVNEAAGNDTNAASSSGYTAEQAAAAGKQVEREDGDSNPVADRTEATLDKVRLIILRHAICPERTCYRCRVDRGSPVS